MHVRHRCPFSAYAAPLLALRQARSVGSADGEVELLPNVSLRVVNGNGNGDGSRPWPPPLPALQPAYWFARLLMSSSTTLGSASVLVSPRLSSSLVATLRRMRRMILPDRVFGRPGAH